MNRSIRAVPVPDEVPTTLDGAASAVDVGKSPIATGPSLPASVAEVEANKVGESFQQRVARHETLRQVEALLEAALRHTMTIGWTDRESGGCYVLRPDGTEVKPLDIAVEMAVNRLHPLLEAVTAEIAAIEGASTEKRVAYQAIIDETSSSHSPSRGPHAVESIGQYIDTLVRDAVKAELDRRTRFSRKSRKDAQTSE